MKHVRLLSRGDKIVYDGRELIVGSLHYNGAGNLVAVTAELIEPPEGYPPWWTIEITSADIAVLTQH